MSAEAGLPKPDLEAESFALLEALAAQAPIGLAVTDRDLRYRFVNEALATINGLAPAAHVGLAVHEVLPDIADSVIAGYERVLVTGEPVVDLPMSGETPAAPGVRRQWTVSFYPLRNRSGELMGLGSAVVEVTAQHRLEAEQVGLVEQIENERLRLEAVIRQMPAGLAIAEAPSGRLILGNRQLEEIFRRPFQVSQDEGWGTLHLDGRPVAEHERPIGRSVRSGEVVEDAEFLIERGDGTQGAISVSTTPVHDAEGRIVAAVATVLDVTERRFAEAERAELLESEHAARLRAEESEERLRAQLSFTSALTENLGEGLWAFGVDERITYVNAAAERMLGWSRGELIGRLSHDTLHYLYPDGSSSPAADCPLLAVVRSRSVVRSEGDVLMRKDGTMLPVAYTSSPILYGEEVVGGVMSFTDISERQRVEAERTRLLDLEHAARLRAERAERRSAFLAQAGAMLGASLDYEATLANLTRLVVPQLADWCTVDMVVGDGVERLAAAHVDPEKARIPMELARRFPADREGQGPLQTVLRTGDPLIVPEVSEEVLASITQDEEHLAALRSLGLRSGMVVPLEARGRTFGALQFISSDADRRFDEDDLSLAAELGRRCGLAVDNARLYRERSYIARTLQESLLPALIPRVPGFEVAARYHAAGEGNEVGGDFYDLFEVPCGWAVVIGDVSGKGAAAAAVTALARYTVRAAALTAESPGEVLRFLNAAMLRHRQHDRFCTVSLVFLRTGEDPPVAEVANGGHPLPMVVGTDGSVEPLGVPGTLLGVLPDPVIEDVRRGLGPGDKLVLYTDGVTEVRVADGLLGGSGLTDLLRRSASVGAGATAEQLERFVLDASGSDLRDDTAIVVLRSLGHGADRVQSEGTTREAGFERGLSLRLAGGPEAPSAARTALLELSPRIEGGLLQNARLLVSELVTNSVRHAGAGEEESIVLDVLLSPDGLRVEVADNGPGFEARSGFPGLAQVSGRGLFLVEHIADRWGIADHGSRVWFELDRGGGLSGP